MENLIIQGTTINNVDVLEEESVNNYIVEMIRRNKDILKAGEKLLPEHLLKIK